MSKTFPQKTIDTIVDSLNRYGITNKNIQVGILAVVSTEGGFVPKSEMSYKNTSNTRLRILFGSRLPVEEEALNALKKDDVAFYEAIYGKRYGNDTYGDGHKFRGRGFNQVTFKNAYKKIGDEIGVDLISNPEKLNEIPVAADALAAYFRSTLKDGIASGRMKNRFKVSKLDDVKDIDLGTKIAFSCNAGWAIDWSKNSALAKEHEIQLQNALVLKDQVK